MPAELNADEMSGDAQSLDDEVDDEADDEVAFVDSLEVVDVDDVDDELAGAGLVALDDARLSVL